MNQTKPYAVAKIVGNATYPQIKGTVSFYDVYGGTMIACGKIKEDSYSSN